MTILIIEDDERVSSFLKRGLEAEGYGVRIARDGVAGLAMATAQDSKVIILDLKLPGIEGLEVCSEIRSRGIYSPILMLTARDTLEDKVQGLETGADDYLTKPFAFDELMARVNALARRGRNFESKPTRLSVGDLSFDRETLRVRRGARAIDMTSKELAILELLISSPGKVFSRERILASIWGADLDPLTNIVEVYIGKMRKKIDGEGDPPLLQTVRGRGYRLSAGDDEE